LPIPPPLGTALTPAVNSADGVYKDNSASAAAISQAIAALNAAVAVFTRQPGTAPNRDALSAQIAAAETAMNGVRSSADGSEWSVGEKWVTPQGWAALNAALAAARSGNADPDTTFDRAAALTAALQAQVTAFNGLKKDGLVKASAVTVTFTGPADEDFTLSSLTLSWAANASSRVQVPAGYASYAWFVDGKPVEGAAGNVFTLNARDYSAGAHRLAARVAKGDGSVFSKQLVFTVN